MVSFDSSNSNSGDRGDDANHRSTTSNNPDSKKLQVFRQQASAVSQALWPSNLHRSQVIGKTVQKHRRVPFSGMHLLWTVQNIPASVPVLLVITSTIVGGSIVTALRLHLWYVLLLPTLLLAFTTLVIVPPLLRKLNHMPKPTKPTKPTKQTIIQSTPRTFKSSPGILVSHHSLETPMPKTPLVRELETFDLSETGVEHFLDVNSGSGVRERAAEHRERMRL
ncbi:MAG: hypothetical protein ACYDER_15575 [Ktedonobacteraceae bacterium]